MVRPKPLDDPVTVAVIRLPFFASLDGHSLNHTLREKLLLAYTIKREPLYM